MISGDGKHFYLTPFQFQGSLNVVTIPLIISMFSFFLFKNKEFISIVKLRKSQSFLKCIVNYLNIFNFKETFCFELNKQNIILINFDNKSF